MKLRWFVIGWLAHSVLWWLSQLWEYEKAWQVSLATARAMIASWKQVQQP